MLRLLDVECEPCGGRCRCRSRQKDAGRTIDGGVHEVVLGCRCDGKGRPAGKQSSSNPVSPPHLPLWAVSARKTLRRSIASRVERHNWKARHARGNVERTQTDAYADHLRLAEFPLTEVDLPWRLPCQLRRRLPESTRVDTASQAALSSSVHHQRDSAATPACEQSPAASLSIRANPAPAAEPRLIGAPSPPIVAVTSISRRTRSISLPAAP